MSARRIEIQTYVLLAQEPSMLEASLGSVSELPGLRASVLVRLQNL